jgi:Na+/melibiose symporter-like transporter
MSKRKAPSGEPLQALAPIRPGLGVLLLYAAGQLGWSLTSYGVGNLLIYFYMPPEQGQPIFPSFLYQGAVLGLFTLVGILSAGGRLLDALVDPLVANWSDRKETSLGKRRWFMLVGALPFALFGFLVFYPLEGSESAGNFLWLALMIGLYYFFFAFYVIPYTALMAELGHTPADRMRISTLTSVAWAVGFILGNSAYALQGLFEARGHDAVRSFQLALALLNALGLVFMLLPALFLREKRYARQANSDHAIGQALRAVFRNRNFRWFLASDLMYWLSLTFIQLGVAFYATLLLGLDKSYAFQFGLLSFLGSFLFYWPVNVLAGKMGKKRLMLLAFAFFAVVFAVLTLCKALPFPPEALLYGLSLASAFPLATFGILPNAIIGDEVEQEERRSGQQLSGMFYGVRAFVMKLGVSLSNLLFPSLLLFGKSTENPLGVQLTSVAAVVFCLVGWWLFGRYREDG